MKDTIQQCVSSRAGNVFSSVSIAQNSCKLEMEHMIIFNPEHYY